ncbi:MAG TPA: hypothetical protein DDX51_04945 [Clostridiales bacterium]|nr:hypothetical protein [Clostridiales bacterium]
MLVGTIGAIPVRRNRTGSPPLKKQECRFPNLKSLERAACFVVSICGSPHKDAQNNADSELKIISRASTSASAATIRLIVAGFMNAKHSSNYG